MALVWGPPTPWMHRHCLPARQQNSCALRLNPRLSVSPAVCPLPVQVGVRQADRSSRCTKALTVARATNSQPGDGTKEAVSRLRYTRGSALKFRRVLDQIRGRSYPEALFLLENMPFRACEPLKDLLIAVAADAKHNFQMSKSKLFVSECYADQAGIIKRFRPRARGRGYKIKKGVSHVTIKVKEGTTLEDQATAATQA